MKCHKLTGLNPSLRTVRSRRASLRASNSCKRKIKDKPGLTGFVRWKITSF